MSMNAQFYVLKQDDNAQQSTDARFDLAAKIAADQYRLGHRVFIYADNTDMAPIDDHLVI